MTNVYADPGRLPSGTDRDLGRRLAASAARRTGPTGTVDAVGHWFAEYSRQAYAVAERVPLDTVDGWAIDPDSGDIRHRTGGFFTVHGLEFDCPGTPVPQWDQPIINQPEVGILGILVTSIDGVLHCLMQAKVEPGNANGLQLSPTVQATRSNYTRVHGGRSVPYLEHFRDLGRHPDVFTDVRQSEQGAWFYRKRNRNVVVQTTDDVEVLDGYRWMTIGQIHALLAMDDMVNMDARTVLSCLAIATEPPMDEDDAGDDFRSALRRSGSAAAPARHSMHTILNWITEMRARTECTARRTPLGSLRGWVRTPERISHETGSFFHVIGVRVEAGGREVAQWSQPMIEPAGDGLIAFVVRPIDGVLHVLMHARVEPGYLDVVELAPTVQCRVDNYAHLPASALPAFLDVVLGAAAEQIRYSTLLSEEGGRFYRALNRYMIVETSEDVALDHPEYRWLTLHQLAQLLEHSHYVNVQARSLIACLRSLLADA